MNIMNEEKHFNTLNNYYRDKYHQKVFKISLNGGFTCPHGHCTYCSASGSGDFAGEVNKSIDEQFNDVKENLLRKWHDALYIVYFQANSNTNADVKVLKEKYEKALSLDEKIIGISIATRCDCISDECLNYLVELNKKTFVQIELGLQTIKEETALLINRGHNLECFDTMIKKLKQNGLSVVVHIINGLPFETKDDMLKTARYVANLGIDGIKIHMLHIMKNTILGNQYLDNPFSLLSLEEYASIVVEQIALLPKEMIVHRVTGDAPKDMLIAPLWTLKKFVVMNEIDKLMRKKNIYQGDKKEA